MRLTFISKLQMQVTVLTFDAHKKKGRRVGVENASQVFTKLKLVPRSLITEEESITQTPHPRRRNKSLEIFVFTKFIQLV